MINKKIRDKIVSQALDEIEFAYKHKKGAIERWKKNEKMALMRKEQRNPGEIRPEGVQFGKKGDVQIGRAHV